MMNETESIERVVEGLKQAADAASHLAYLEVEPRMGLVVAMLDVIRRAACKALNRQYGEDTAIVRESRVTESWAFMRLVDGLRQAAGGARQIAVYHRKSESMLGVVKQLDRMEQSASALMLKRAPLIAAGARA